MPEVRPARPDDDEALTRLLYVVASGMYDIYAGGAARSHDLIRTAIARPGVGASRETMTVAELDGEVAGVLCAFPGREAGARGNRFVLLALRRLPPWRWLPILRVEMAAARVFPAPPKDALYVDALATDERFRRRGVATALLDAADERARALGFAKVALDTTAVNTGAQALYEGVGFREVGRSRGAGVIPSEVIYVRELA